MAGDIFEPNSEPGQPGYYPVSQTLIDWLDGGRGRGEYFSKVDPLLPPTRISKIKVGRVPITFEDACRLARAQKPSDNPFKPDEIMTFAQDRELYRYVIGEIPAPAEVDCTRKPRLARRWNNNAPGL
jgi:hypothetical protein